MEVGSSSLPGTTSSDTWCWREDVGRRPSSVRHRLSCGGLAQLARAPALQAGGQRFESVILHHPVPFDCALCIVNCALEEFFDILTHKTVSKDFKLYRLRETLNVQLKV